jgi:hypothetical protein
MVSGLAVRDARENQQAGCKESSCHRELLSLSAIIKSKMQKIGEIGVAMRR